jgi:1,4-dihydroxy-2-naphthoate octaprenyltransferase
VNRWIEGARPKTLAASLVPVLVGTSLTQGIPTNYGPLRYYSEHSVIWWRFAAALVVSLAIQVGVNYANDYFDGRKGVDTLARVGPLRLTASGTATHKEMKIAIATAFGVAGIAGLALAAATSWWLLAVGAASFLAALAYSGGSRPYANAALGELFVFVFFGIIATVGSAFVQVGHIHQVPEASRSLIENVVRTALVASIPVGLIATAILVVNNLRDIDTDAAAGKRTLAVRIGRRNTRILYRSLIALSFVMLAPIAVIARSAWPLLALLAINFAVKPTMLVGEETPPKLIAALVATARLHLVFGTLLATGLWLR